MSARFSLSPQSRAMLGRIGTIVLLAVTALYVGLIGTELVQQAQHWPVLHRERDFPSYYLAAQRLLRGEDFYSGLKEGALSLGIEDYFIDAAVTPPTFAVTLAPLALFPYPVAWGIWQILSVAALVLSLWLVLRQKQCSLSPLGWARLGCAVLLFPPLTFHLLYAHTELFLLLLLAGGWYSLRRRREIAGGVLLGMAGAIRIYPLFLLIFLIQRRAWKALLAALAAGLGLAAVAALAAGPSSYLGYVDVLGAEVSTLYARWGNFSLYGDVHKLASIWPALGQQPLVRDLLAILLSLGTLILTLLLTWKRRSAARSIDRDYGLFTVATLLASPLSWIYYQVLLYLPLLFLLDTLRRNRGPRAIPWILAAALLASLCPIVEGQPGLPLALKQLLAFFPTLTLAGVYVALVMAAPDAAQCPCRNQGS